MIHPGIERHEYLYTAPICPESHGDFPVIT